MSDAPNRTILVIDALDVEGAEGLQAHARAADLERRDSVHVAVALRWTDGRSRVVVEPLPEAVVARQMDVARRFSGIDSGVIGCVASRDLVAAVGSLVDGFTDAPWVLAPTFRAGGADVVDAEVADETLRALGPKARVCVLRASDLLRLSDVKVEGLDDLRDAVASVRGRGVRAVLVTGWQSRDRVYDLLDDDGRVAVLDAPRVTARRLRGLGSGHAFRLASELADDALLVDAVRAAQRFVGARLARAPHDV